MSEFRESSDKVSNTINNDKQNNSETKIQKKAKAENIFKRIFSHKTKFSKKAKSPNDNIFSKIIPQSSIPPYIEEYKDVGGLIPIVGSKSTRILSENSLNPVLKTDIECQQNICERKEEEDNLGVNTSKLLSSELIIKLPEICEEPPLDGNGSLTNLTDKERIDKISVFLNDRNKKSTNNGSVVDMVLTDDSRKKHNLKTENMINLKIPSKLAAIKRSDSATSWRKLKAALVWTPFIQQYARHRYPWIQIAGHQGNFKPGEQGTILKKHTGQESICLQMMCKDILSDFVPSFKGDVEFEDEKYICMQDLLAQFNMPSLMDIKIGTRTYLEEELIKAKSCPKPRQDMYEKMIEVDKEEPTEEEHRLKAVIKPRYMQWRETLSSTLTLGFRIEGIKKTGCKNNKNVGTQSRNYKRTKYRDEVKESLLDFIDNNRDLPAKFIRRIKSLKSNLEKSVFFWHHEFIGSSLLFVHDKSGRANVWMIDFGKTVPLPPECRIDHISQWIEGNHEDGYLFGLENLLMILEEIHSELSIDSH